MVVRLRPLTVGTLTLISRAAREDVSLVPLLMVKEALAEPAGAPGLDVRDFTGGAAVPTSAISGAGLQPGVALPVGSATGARSERAALRVP